MRIIGGSLKGKSITPPMGYKARPTTDFAKEGLFNILTNDLNFEDISFLDLFSGTGSISFEFASRGCKDIISVEMNPENFRFIKRTCNALNLEGVQTLKQNVFDFLKICTKEFDLIFADPPYAIDNLEGIPDKILNSDKRILKSDGLLILEHPDKFSFETHPYFIKEKRYGNVHFSFFKYNMI